MIEVKNYDEFVRNILNITKYDVIALDTETTGLNPRQAKILSIQVATPDKVYVFHGDSNIFKLLAEYIEDKKVVAHNAKFDISVIYTNTGVLLKNVYCTMLAERIITSGLNLNFYESLASLVNKYLGITLDKSARESFYNQDNYTLTREQIEYAANDVRYLLTIYGKQMESIKSLGLEKAAELEFKFVPVLVITENYGVRLDTKLWMGLSEKAKDETEKKRQDILSFVINDILKNLKYENAYDICMALGISNAMKRKSDVNLLYSITDDNLIADVLRKHLNISSNVQVLNIIRKVYGIDIPDTNEKTLNKVNHPFINMILEYREAFKSESSFGESFLRFVESDGRIHTDYNQLGAVTGRMSSSNPNLQNIKRESDYRRPFIPADGFKFICADYSQEELRIMADVSREAKMIEAFNAGKDLHALTASILFNKKPEEITKEERSVGKALNFGVIYGISEKGLFRNFGISEKEGKKYLEKFFNELYPTFGAFYKTLGNIVLQKNYSSTLLGRKRFFNPEVDDSQSIVRKGVNMLIQGTGADIIKIAMNKIFYENPFGHDRLRVVLQVHDEIVVEVEESIAEEGAEFVKTCMLEAEGMFLKYVKPEIDYKIADYWVH